MHNVPRSKAIAYELLFDGSAGNDSPHLMGLLDADCLQKYTYDKQKSGLAKEKSASSRGSVGVKKSYGIRSQYGFARITERLGRKCVSGCVENKKES
jgi:hypothetical protein